MVSSSVLKQGVKQGAASAAIAAKKAAKKGAIAAKKAAKKGAASAAASAKRAAKKGAATAAIAAKKAARAASKNAGKLITAGLVVGGGIYLEKKFEDADEDIKNCMQVCLPENWDDHAYGSLEKSELKYRILEGEDANSDQPLCTEAKDDCGKYCSDKCEELHEYDIPGSDAARGLGKGLGKGLEGLLKGLEKIFDPSGMASKFSLIMSVLIIIMITMQMMT